MEKNFDPNIPEISDDGYFCRLCLINANSDHMWAIHVAGKRHYRNVKKYPNGIPFRQERNDDRDSFEKPAKYGRYKKDEWNGSSPEDYESEYYTRRNYKPEIKPQVIIDYGHKKTLSDVTSPPASETFDDVSVKKRPESPISQIFVDEKFDELKKSFEEKIFKAQTDGNKQSNKRKPDVKDSVYEDDFEKELDELLDNHTDGPESEKNTFSNDNFKRKIDNLFSGKLYSTKTKDKELKILSTVDCTKNSDKKSNKTIPVDSTPVKKRDDGDKIKSDKDLFKKKNKKKNEEDFLDIFHKMNDQKLFEMSAADEPEENYSVKKSKTENPKLDDFDPDKLTTDHLDNLLSLYLKPKTDSSMSKESSENSTKISSEANNSSSTNKEDDLDSFSRKLESLSTKKFFEIVLARLKKLDLKDSDELKMLLGVISEAQEVVCKKLPPHLQAVLKSKMSHNNPKTNPAVVQYPVLSRTESVATTPPVVPQTVSKPALPTTSYSDLKSVHQPLSQKEVKCVLQPVSSISPQPVQTPVSNATSLKKSPYLSNSDSFQSMIAWQNYLTSTEKNSGNPVLSSENSVQATIAYQNYLSSLQAKALTASKMLPKTTPKTNPHNAGSLNSYPNSKISLSSPNRTLATPQAAPVSAEKLLSTSKSALTKDILKNLFSASQTPASKKVPQSSSSITKSASTLHSQNQSTSKSCKYVSQSDKQTVSSTAEIPSNTAIPQNQAALQSYQTYYQQMYAMHLQRMTGSCPDFNSLPSALQAAIRKLTASQPNSSLPPHSQPNSTK